MIASMGPRTVGVLFGLSVLLTGYYYLFERQAPPWGPGIGAVFPRLEYQELEEVDLEPGPGARAPGAPAEPVRLRRQRQPGRASWRIEKPAVDANAPRVESIAQSLVELQAIADVPPAEAAAVFDDAGPRLRLRFRTRRAEEHRIEVGRDHPTLELCYARLDGSRLFLARKAFVKNVSSSLDDLRSRSLFPIPSQRAAALEVVGDANASKRVRREGESERWRFESPQPAPAHRERLARTLDELNAWRAESFVRDEEGDLAPYGLERPRLTIAMTDLGGERLALEVGAAAPVKGQVYVKWAGKPFVMTASAAPLEGLERSAEHLYSEYVIDLGASEVVEIAVKPAGGPGGFTLRRLQSAAPPKARPAGSKAAPAAAPGPAEWSVELPGGVKLPGDAVKGDALARGLAHLLIKRYVPLPGGSAPASTGRGEPVARVDLLTDTGDRRTLAFERPQSAEAAARNVLLVLADGEPFYFEVITPILDDLLGSGIRYRDARLSRLDPENLTEFELRRGEWTWTLGKLRVGWRLALDGAQRLRPDAVLDEKVVERAARALGSEELRAQEWKPEERDLAARELLPDRFRLRVTLLRVEGEARAGFQNLYLGAPQAAGAVELATWGRVDAPELSELPFLLDVRVARAFRDLADHLEGITERAQ